MRNPTHAIATSVPRAIARRPRLRTEHALVALVVALTALLALVPLAFLVWRTFVVNGALTLDSFRRAYSTVGLWEMIANSLWFAAGSTLLGVTAGTVLAFLVVRTDLPWRRVVVALLVVQFVLPGVLYTSAWVFLASPRSGAINRALEPLFGSGAFDVFSLGGMVLVEGLDAVPFAFLLLAAAFASMDADLEESALASGAPVRSVLRRVTLPLARPALAAAILIVLIRALEAFEVPALVGLPGGVWVFTAGIWEAFSDYPADYGVGGAYALSLLLLTTVGVVVLSRVLSRRRRFQTLSGRGVARRPLELGRWRIPLAVAVFAFLAVAVVLPVAILVYASLRPFYTPPSIDALSGLTTENYGAVLSKEETLDALRNTVVLAVGTATIVVVLGAAAAWLVVRTKMRGRWAVDSLAFMPIATPSLVLGSAMLVLYVRVPLPIYGTLWILLIAFVTASLPAGIRFGVAAMQQVADEVEESAHASGARWWAMFRRVLLPFIAPGLAACWIYVFVASFRHLSVALLLYAPGDEVLSIELWTLYSAARFPELAALGLLMTALLLVLVGIAYKLARRFLLVQSRL